MLGWKTWLERQSTRVTDSTQRMMAGSMACDASSGKCSGVNKQTASDIACTITQPLVYHSQLLGVEMWHHGIPARCLCTPPHARAPVPQTGQAPGQLGPMNGIQSWRQLHSGVLYSAEHRQARLVLERGPGPHRVGQRLGVKVPQLGHHGVPHSTNGRATGVVPQLSPRPRRVGQSL